MIFGELGAGGREIEQLLPFPNEMRIPLRTILIAERAQFAGGIEPRGQTRGVQRHERGKREGGRRGGERMFAKRRREAHGFTAEFGAHGGFG